MSWADNKIKTGVTNADYVLDYSAAKISGHDIRVAGYTGVIRYIDEPSRLGRKHTNKAEYGDHIANDLHVKMVMQVGTADADGGYAFGREKAIRAARGMDYLGYGGLCFFTNDRVSVPDAGTWKAHLDGAVSILGIERVGAYGFKNAVDFAIGHADDFWQAGRRSDVSDHTNYWQDNNQQVTVAGIICDRNLMKSRNNVTSPVALQPHQQVLLEPDQLAVLQDSIARITAILTMVDSGANLGDHNPQVNELRKVLLDVQDRVSSLSLGSVDLDMLSDKVVEKLLARLNLKQAQA